MHCHIKQTMSKISKYSYTVPKKFHTHISCFNLLQGIHALLQAENAARL